MEGDRTIENIYITEKVTKNVDLFWVVYKLSIDETFKIRSRVMIDVEQTVVLGGENRM